MTALRRHLPHARSFVLGVTEYLVYPLLVFLGTPIMLRALGEADFGLWLLLASVTGLVTVAGFGMGTATTKFVAHYRGRASNDDVLAIVRHTLAVSLAGGLVIALPLLLAAPWIADHVFPKMGHAETVTAILRAGALLVLLAQIDGTFAAAMRGCERFGTVTALEGTLKTGGVAIGLAVATTTRRIDATLLATVLYSACGSLLRAYVMTRMIGGKPWLPRWSKAHATEVWSFGGWNWLNTMSSLLFVHVDRVIVGSAMGAAALAHYGICIQLGSQIHAIPAAGLAFLLPLLSRKLATAHDPDHVRNARNRAILLTVAIATAAAGFLLVFGHLILDLWVGRSIREAIEAPFLLTIVCYFLLALNIGPYYVLLGQGEARLVSVTSLTASALSALAAFILIPRFGLIGGIAAKTIYSVAMLILYVRIVRPTPGADAVAPT